MLEFFVIKDMVKLFEKESFKTKERFDYNPEIVQILDENSSNNIDIIVFLTSIVVLLISILTAKHAYECGKKYSLFGRILYMLFAFFFTGLYMVYYFVRNGLMRKKC